MHFRKWSKQLNWIEHLRVRWFILAPPQRLLITTVAIGVLFTTFLTALLDDTPTSKHESASPNDYGLVATTTLPEGTMIELIHFSFKRIPDRFRFICPNPITLSQANRLKGHRLRSTLNRGEFLCGSNIEVPPLFERTPSIRRGQRVMGFRLNNPEIVPFLNVGSVVDAILGGDMAHNLHLEHVRIINLLHHQEGITILLEIPKATVAKIEQKKGLLTHVQILLKNQNEPKTLKRRRPQAHPKVHKG